MNTAVLDPAIFAHELRAIALLVKAGSAIPTATVSRAFAFATELHGAVAFPSARAKREAKVALGCLRLLSAVTR